MKTILNEKEIQNIKAQVALILQKNEITEPKLRDRIFGLLEREGTLIFFPLEEKDVWGIYMRKNGNNFFVINTNIELEKQVFAAAHELAHTLEFAEVSFEFVKVEQLKDYTNSNGREQELIKADLLANRFAAELLVGSKHLRNSYNSLSMYYQLVSKTLLLSDEYLVPFKTIAKRLFEEELITKKDVDYLLNIEKKLLTMLKERFEICTENIRITGRKQLGNYIDKAIKIYDNDYIDYDKLEEWLKLVSKTPEDFERFEDLDFYEALKNYSGEEDK